MLNAPFSTSLRKSLNSVELAISKFKVPRPSMIICHVVKLSTVPFLAAFPNENVRFYSVVLF